MNSDIQQAITILKQGGVVIYPTDTAFGIGCRMDDEVAVKRLFEIRKRPLTQATPVLFDTITRVKSYVATIPESVEDLMQKYWPGAVTMILKGEVEKIPELVRGGTDTIGTRIPDHEVPIQLVQGTDAPLLGPSANFHGEPTPFMFEELDKELIKLVDYVVPGVCKPGRVASTVVNCTTEPWQILRQGAVRIKI